MQDRIRFWSQVPGIDEASSSTAWIDNSKDLNKAKCKAQKQVIKEYKADNEAKNTALTNAQTELAETKESLTGVQKRVHELETQLQQQALEQQTSPRRTSTSAPETEEVIIDPDDEGSSSRSTSPTPRLTLRPLPGVNPFQLIPQHLPFLADLANSRPRQVVADPLPAEESPPPVPESSPPASPEPEQDPDLPPFTDKLLVAFKGFEEGRRTQKLRDILGPSIDAVNKYKLAKIKDPKAEKPKLKQEDELERPKTPEEAVHAKLVLPTSPEVKAPEAKVPEVKAPEIKAPEIKAPEVKAPEAVTTPTQQRLALEMPQLRINLPAKPRPTTKPGTKPTPERQNVLERQQAILSGLLRDKAVQAPIQGAADPILTTEDTALQTDIRNLINQTRSLHEEVTGLIGTGDRGLAVTRSIKDKLSELVKTCEALTIKTPRGTQPHARSLLLHISIQLTTLETTVRSMSHSSRARHTPSAAELQTRLQENSINIEGQIKELLTLIKTELEAKDS